MDNEDIRALELIKPIYNSLGRRGDSTSLDKILCDYESVIQIYPNLEQILAKYKSFLNQIFFKVGLTYQLRTKHPEAIDSLTRAIYLEPSQINLYKFRLDSYLAMNDNQRAAEDSLLIDCLKKINLIINDHNKYKYSSQKTFMAFKPIFESCPNILSHITNISLLNLLGQNFQQEGQYTDAISCFTSIINSNNTIIEGNPIQALDAFQYRSESYIRLGDIPAAEQDYAEIQRLIAFKGIDPVDVEYKKELMKFVSNDPSDRERLIRRDYYSRGLRLPETEELNEKVQGLSVELDDLVLGSGAFGVVVKGCWNQTPVAIKLTHHNYDHIDDMGSENCFPSIFRLFSHEIEMQRTLSHPNIIKLLAFHRGADYNQTINIFMVFEIMKLGSLYQVLLDTTIDLPWSMRLNMAIECASGLSYLHDQGILHRDIKSKNIMVDEHMQLKIGDFGTAVKRSDSSFFNQRYSKQKVGTRRYLAPELSASSTYSEFTDIWALAIVLREICNRDKPYKKDELKLQMAQCNQDEFSSEIPSSIIALILQCW